MKKSILLALFVGFYLISFAQTIERQVISSAGSFSSASGISLSATVGEVATTTLINGTVVLTQGFQQPNKEDLTNIPEDKKVNVAYKIYPNPTSDKLMVEITSDKSAELIIEICDINGKNVALVSKNLVLNGTVTEEMDMSTLAAGTYLLRLVYGKEAVRTFSVIKK